MKVGIVGAGIGGLCTALALHKAGVACELNEQVAEPRELGVGLTLLPHAVATLARLGLLDALDSVAIRSEHLYFMTRMGQGVWDEPRGLAAGYDLPQFFVHRGKLQSVLLSAVRARLPPSALRLGSRLMGYRVTDRNVEARFSSGGAVERSYFDVLVGADGIHSAVRRQIYPGEGPPRWSGLMLWRGATEWPDFLGGASVMILGGVNSKFVAYPIAPGSAPGTKLTNWAAIVRLAPDGSEPPSRENWSALGRREELTPYLDRFSSGALDLKGLVAATDVFWEYPMCDREPVSRWNDGPVTLLGDAAHPMYPMGANGASQAILDARLLADLLARNGDVEPALAAYEAERIGKTTPIVYSNRGGGPEGLIDAVESRAPGGFADIESIMPFRERQAFMAAYAHRAGFALEQLARAGR